MKKYFWFLIFIFVGFSGCESDDICDAGTPTTPRVVIEFYNYNNQSFVKNVINLSIIGDGMSTGLILNPTTAVVADRVFFNGSKVSVPLKIDQNTTTYNFIFNSKTPAIPSTDVIKFSYSKVNEYVSRACGYRTYFEFGTLASSFSINNVPGSTSGSWIRDVQILTQTIKDETTTHIKIFI